MVKLPTWALVVMWAATMIGAFMLSRAMWSQFGNRTK